MITTDQFKDNATRFRRRAKKLGFDLPLTTLLQIYTSAHYGASYEAVRARAWIDEPEFPPPLLENAAWRFNVEAALILEALEQMPAPKAPSLTSESQLTAEDFRAKAKLFRQVAPLHGIKLKMTRASDFYAAVFFDRHYSAVMAALGQGKRLGWSDEPEYLDAACAMYGVDPRRAYEALIDMFSYGNGL